MAHLLARLIYRMLKIGREYVANGMGFHETKDRQQRLQWVAKQAAALNMQLIPVAGVPVKFLESADAELHAADSVRAADG